MKKLIFALLTVAAAGCASSSAVFQDGISGGNDGLSVSMPEFSIYEHIYDCNNAKTFSDELKDVFAEFDIPLTMTPRVNDYINYFTGDGREYMQRWLDRSNKYMYLVRDRFIREGIPSDLVVLAFTESGYNPMAYSRAGAAGMWQFMRSTGAMYGLSVNDWIDERRDFEKATDAAARHLKDLHKSFDDWYLALAAYNAGSGKISNATKKHRSKDFFEIASGRTLKKETKDYVPKYLAQLIIYKNMKEYGFESPQDAPLLFDTITINKQINLHVLAQHLGITYSELKELNPELKTPITPPVKSYTLRVPLDKHKKSIELVNSDINLTRYHIYKASSGERIANIAKKYKVSAKSIKLVNSFPYDTIYTSKILFIPTESKLSEIDNDFAKEIANLTPKYYTVRRGDNMTLISRKHNIPLNTLVKLNPRINPRRIYPGQVIVISQGGLTS